MKFDQVILVVFAFVFTAKALDKLAAREDVVVTIPAPTEAAKGNHPWCRNIMCPDTTHCSTKFRTYWTCCPQCGCTNQMSVSMSIGQKFRLQKEAGSCFECKCERRNSWENPVADCMQVKCRSIGLCKKSYVPPDKCCPVCEDNEKEGSEIIRPTFPPIPENLFNLKK